MFDLGSGVAVQNFRDSRAGGDRPQHLPNRRERRQAMTTHSLWRSQARSITGIHFGVKLDPLLFKVETRLTAIRAVNRA
jgi:hypothetical protein